MENNLMIQLITRYLSENNYKEVALKLQSESNNQLYTELYTKLNTYITQSEYQNARIVIRKELNEQTKNPNQSTNLEFLIILYNSIFLRYIYSSIDSLDNSKLLSEIQDHMTNISLFLTDNIKIEQFKAIKLKKDLEAMKTALASILFSRKTEGFVKLFPQISSNDTLLLYINKQYYQHVFGNDLRLEQLIEDVYKYQIAQCLYHNCKDDIKHKSYYNQHTCSKAQFIPNKIGLSIDTEHEVQNIIYSNTGKYFAVILSNKTIIIYTLSNNSKSIEITESKVITSRHSDTITSLSWNKNDTLILTTSKDKTIKLYNPFNGQCNKKFDDIHDAMVICATFTNNDTHFASCGLDYRVNITSIEGVKEFTIRLPGISVTEVLYSELYNTLIIVAVTSNTLIFYDLNKRIEKSKISINDAIISCSISKTDKGKYLLVNSSKATPVLIWINLEDGSVIRKFFGHRQERLTIKCNFGGYNENFIVCGSENANVYVWNKNCSIPIAEVKAHSSSVNAVAWPYHSITDVILSCSDDHTISVIRNEEVEKLYFNQAKKLENKMVNLEENNVMPLPQHTVPDPSSVATNILSRLSGILRHIGYGSDAEDDNDNES